MKYIGCQIKRSAPAIKLPNFSYCLPTTSFFFLMSQQILACYVTWQWIESNEFHVVGRAEFHFWKNWFWICYSAENLS